MRRILVHRFLIALFADLLLITAYHASTLGDYVLQDLQAIACGAGVEQPQDATPEIRLAAANAFSQSWMKLYQASSPSIQDLEAMAASQNEECRLAVIEPLTQAYVRTYSETDLVEKIEQHLKNNPSEFSALRFAAARALISLVFRDQQRSYAQDPSLSKALRATFETIAYGETVEEGRVSIDGAIHEVRLAVAGPLEDVYVHLLINNIPGAYSCMDLPKIARETQDTERLQRIELRLAAAKAFVRACVVSNQLTTLEKLVSSKVEEERYAAVVSLAVAWSASTTSNQDLYDKAASPAPSGSAPSGRPCGAPLPNQATTDGRQFRLAAGLALGLRWATGTALGQIDPEEFARYHTGTALACAAIPPLVKIYLGPSGNLVIALTEPRPLVICMEESGGTSRSCPAWPQL